MVCNNRTVGAILCCLQIVFSQGSASTVGIFLRSWNQAGEGGAAVLYNWESSLLEVVFEALDPATMTFSLTAPMARRIGGPITHKPGQPLALRLMLDGRWVCHVADDTVAEVELIWCKYPLLTAPATAAVPWRLAHAPHVRLCII